MAAVVVAVILIFFLRKPAAQFLLSDGTEFKLICKTAGTKQLDFMFCRCWLSMWDSIRYLHAPYEKFSVNAVYTNGAVGLVFRRQDPNGKLSYAANGSVGLTFVDERGRECPAIRKLVFFDNHRAKTGTIVTTEDIIYEIPALSTNELEIRILETNQTSAAVLTHTFKIPNPAR